ncbi:hypothetical protein DOT_2420 [Desulfosporosinus sp. OT]|nr:hypothetical protein DOT_2420 [Desulfosporosinus sp. OT]
MHDGDTDYSIALETLVTRNGDAQNIFFNTNWNLFNYKLIFHLT